MIRRDCAYYAADAAGRLIDGPFCCRCYQTDGVAWRVVPIEGNRVVLCERCQLAVEVAIGVIFPPAKTEAWAEPLPPTG
jgi:hypothetical protein